MHAGKTLEDRIVLDVLEFHGVPWGQVSSLAKDMIRQMLRKDPDQRPSAQQLLQHPWFTLEEPGLDQPLDGVMHCLSVVGSSHIFQSCKLHALSLLLNSSLTSPPQRCLPYLCNKQHQNVSPWYTCCLHGQKLPCKPMLCN